MKLSQGQVQFFLHTGYLVSPTTFSNEYCDILCDKILHEMQQEVSPYTKDDQGRIVRISNVSERDSLREIIILPEIIEQL